jgi:hypothetical protein
MRVLIALVGEQPTPNLIPLFTEPPERRAECVQFMVSANQRVRDVADHLAEAIRRDPALANIRVAEPLFMDAWVLDKARADCEAAIARYTSDELSVNLTGGTKMMSLAAYQAAMNTHTPMLYVNTEQERIIDFDQDGAAQTPRSFRAPISIETQLRAAGHEFKTNKPPLRASDVRALWAEFAAYLVDHYVPAHVNLIRKVLRSAGGAGKTVSFTPPGQSVEAARQAHEAGLWVWDEKAGTFTIPDKTAYGFLNGEWVEAFALTSLAKSECFDDVLGRVEVEGFEGDLDVVATYNGRLGIVDCKTTGATREEGMSNTIAKIRLHDVLFGGTYARALFARPSDEGIQNWRRICEQYKLPEPVQGPQLKQLASRLREVMAT